MKELEKRTLNITPVQVRSEEGAELSRTVEGYAALFDEPSELLGGEFTERISPGAFEGVIEVSDVKAWLNHNPDRGILARSVRGKGTLTLTIDERGLKYQFEAPQTALGDELLEGIKRGDILGSSFAFTVESDEWERLENGTYLRAIKKIGRLYDISPVYDPAYSQTSVALRSLEEHKQEDKSKNDNDNDNNLNNNLSVFYL